MMYMRAVSALLSATMAAHAASAAPTTTTANAYKPTDTSNLAAVLASTPQMQELSSYVVKDPCALEEYSTASNVTVFVAVNQAWDDFRKTPLGPSLDNTTLVHAALQYVVVNGIWDTKKLRRHAPIFLRTHLQDPAFSQVTGGQVVKIEAPKGKDKSLLAIQGLNAISTLIRPDVFFDGGVVHVMNNLFIFPQDVVVTAGALGPVLSSLSYLLSLITSPQASLVGVPDITIFAPSANHLDELKSQSQQGSVVSNGAPLIDAYTIAGHVLYSTELKDDTFHARDGRVLHITTKKGVTYVNGKAILQTDFLIANGVVHTIDGIL